MKVLLLLTVFVITLTQAVKASEPEFHIMIVSGHVANPVTHPNTRGTISFSGVDEYQFNDALVTLFANPRNQIKGIRYTIVPATDDLELKARSRLANSLQPDLYLEIHHDAARQADRDKATAEGANSPLWNHIQGFSVHYSEQGKRSSTSRSFAGILAAEMSASGFTPNLYLADRLGMQVVRRDMGIYNRIRPHGLYIFRAIRIPSVVLEVGNIANPHEEKSISTQPVRHQLVNVINTAVQLYLYDSTDPGQ